MRSGRLLSSDAFPAERIETSESGNGGQGQQLAQEEWNYSFIRGRSALCSTVTLLWS
jgi:hypothetical protein